MASNNIEFPKPICLEYRAIFTLLTNRQVFAVLFCPLRHCHYLFMSGLPCFTMLRSTSLAFPLMLFLLLGAGSAPKLASAAPAASSGCGTCTAIPLNSSNALSPYANNPVYIGGNLGTLYCCSSSGGIAVGPIFDPFTFNNFGNGQNTVIPIGCFSSPYVGSLGNLPITGPFAGPYVDSACSMPYTSNTCGVCTAISSGSNSYIGNNSLFCCSSTGANSLNITTVRVSAVGLLVTNAYCAINGVPLAQGSMPDTYFGGTYLNASCNLGPTFMTQFNNITSPAKGMSCLAHSGLILLSGIISVLLLALSI